MPEDLEQKIKEQRLFGEELQRQIKELRKEIERLKQPMPEIGKPYQDKVLNTDGKLTHLYLGNELLPIAGGIEEEVSWTDYAASSTITGWSSFTTKIIYYKKIGNLVFVSFYLAGVSNSANAYFTLPYTAFDDPNNSLSFYFATIVQDNGTWQTTPGRVRIPESTNTSYCGLNFSGDGGFTASGTKAIVGTLWYEAQ